MGFGPDEVARVAKLARLRLDANQVAQLTQQATNGEIALESVYARRLEMIGPTESEVVELAKFYAQKRGIARDLR